MLRSIARLGVAALGAALILGAAAPGRADMPLSPRAKIGIFLPQNGSLSDVTNSVWFKIGADVSLPLGLPVLGGDTRIGIDYAANGSATMVPITLTEIWQPSAVVHNPLYLGVGIGLWNVHVPGAGTSSEFGLRLLGGVDLSSRTFLEAQYDIVSKVHGTDVNGFSLMIGTRF